MENWSGTYFIHFSSNKSHKSSLYTNISLWKIPPYMFIRIVSALYVYNFTRISKTLRLLGSIRQLGTQEYVTPKSPCKLFLYKLGQMASCPDCKMTRWQGGQMARWVDGQGTRWPGGQMSRWLVVLEVRWLGGQITCYPDDQVARWPNH